MRYLAEVPPSQWDRINTLLGLPPSEDLPLTKRQTSRRDSPTSERLSASAGISSGPDKRILEIVVAYCNGATPEAIAAVRHTTEADIRDVLREAGVILRDPGHASAGVREQIRALRSQGLSMRAIARRLGVSHTTISRILRRKTDEETHHFAPHQ
nr:helix-turn-helix domain-containing protein [Microbacterium ulmi]